VSNLHDEHGVSNALLGVIGGVGVLASLALLVYFIAFLGDGSDDDDGNAPSGDVYVSMGDSVAAGSGASDPAETSFVALVAVDEDAELYGVAEAGSTTGDVIVDQLPDLLSILGSGRVRFITISAGGNDLAGLIPNPSCVEDPLPASCPLEETLDDVAARLDEILRLIREADARVPVVLLGYPNFFSNTGHPFEDPAGRVLPQLVEEMRDVASTYERVTVAEPSFDGRGGDLTHVLDEQFDPHPNDAGHRVIADAVLVALEEVR
jgi:lysophospholipase L1-like esterase